MRTTVRVSELRPGDYLIGSERTIVQVRRSSMSGKHIAWWKRDSGTEGSSEWGSRTTMLIERAAATPALCDRWGKDDQQCLKPYQHIGPCVTKDGDAIAGALRDLDVLTWYAGTRKEAK